jgi:molybdopterin-guanine dinucleotide biosynthesis protein B
MKIVAFVGDSGSGKTRLVTRLVPELRKRGLSVSVIKHCAHGFDMGGKDKDSSRFLRAGADGVALAAPGRWAVVKKTASAPRLADLARTQLRGSDIVLVEGGRAEKGLKKIEVLRRGRSEKAKTSKSELVALVADFEAAGEVPAFHPNEVGPLADWLEGDFK